MTVYPCPTPLEATLAPLIGAAGFMLMAALLIWFTLWARGQFIITEMQENDGCECTCNECASCGDKCECDECCDRPTLDMIEENDRTSLQEIVDTVRKRVEANHE